MGIAKQRLYTKVNCICYYISLIFKSKFLIKILHLFIFILPIITYEQIYKENLNLIRDKLKDNIFVVEHLKKKKENWLTQETKDRILIPKMKIKII